MGKPICIFLISLITRILAIDVPINTDETLWMSRGITFINSLLEGNLEATYTRHHPGIINMWLIGSGQLINSVLHHLFPNLLKLTQPPLMYTCVDSVSCPPLSLWIVPRLLQAIVTSACMVLIYILAKKLLGQWLATIAIALLLLEPFFLAYQRYLTTDALQADFSIIGALLLLLYLKHNSDRKYLIFSGIFIGLAISAKIPTLFLLPAIIVWIVLIEFGWWRSSFSPRGWKRQIRDLIILGIIAGVTIFVLWPALWVAPLETFSRLQQGLLREENRGNLFFLGQITDSPGLLFYPVVLIYRLSPLFQLGLLAFIVALSTPKLNSRLTQKPELIALALIPLSVLLILSISDSKIDRYVMLVIPELALLSGAGWLQLYQWVKSWKIRAKLQTRIGSYIAIALIISQLLSLLFYFPYYLTYFNPLFGGLKTAKNLLSIGQGEGLDLAAKWLNKSADAKNLKVLSWHSAPFSVYFSGEVLNMYWTDSPQQNLLEANRVVLYVNQLQRQLPNPEMIAYFAMQQPLYTWQQNDVGYVQIYPGLTPSPQDLEQIQYLSSLSWGKQIRLLGYDLNSSNLKSSEPLLITFYWEFLKSPPSDLTLNFSLFNGKERILEHSETSLVNGDLSFEKITPNTIVRDVRQLIFEKDIPSGSYQLQVGWSLSNTGNTLDADNEAEKLLTSQVTIGKITID